MLCGVGRVLGHRVVVAGTAAASLVALQPAGVRDTSHGAIELDHVRHVVKKSSLVTVDCG